VNFSLRFDEELIFIFFLALDIASGQFQFPHFSVLNPLALRSTLALVRQCRRCWFLNEPLLAAGLPQPQTKPINIWAALLQLQALNVSVSPPSTVKRTLFSGPAKPKLASGYLAQSIATLRNHLDIITFSFFTLQFTGVPEGMDLDPN